MTPEQFAVMRRSLSTRLIEALVRLFLALGAWRDEDVARFLQQAVPLVEGGQRSLAALTSAFIASQATEALGRTIVPPAIRDRDAVNLRKDVDTADVYHRPFVTLYNALSAGKPFPDALKLAENRLAEIAEMDLQQTYASASRAVMKQLPESVRPQFWRRVLTGLENCALCVIASTQRYRVENLNPIHPGCDCQVQQLYGKDPGQVVEPALLEQVHNAVKQLTGEADRGGRAPDYRKLMVQMTPDHGELGPLLVRPRDKFTSAADLPN